MKKIQVLDVTLKVWTEELKKELSFREKLAVANGLKTLCVDAVELPFAEGKEEGVVCRTIAEDASATVTATVSDKQSMENAVSILASAKAKRFQMVLPVSTVQMEYSFHLKAPKMLDKIASLIKLAKTYVDDVELVAKDATRAEDGFVAQVAKVAKENGASAITLYDDAGVFFPDQFAKLVAEVKNSCDIQVFVCPSNKLQMGASTAVEVIKAGADGIKTAVGASDYLSPAVLSDVVRAKGHDLGVVLSIDQTIVHKTVSGILDFDKDGGANATDKKRKGLTFSEESSMSEINDEILALGYEISTADLGKVYEEFKRVCAKKGSIGELELEAIVASTAMQVPTTYHLVNYVVNSGNIITATAHVTLEKDGEQLTGVSVGDGPIDAAFHAIEQTVGHHYQLDDFSVQAVTKGREAVGSAIIKLRANGKLYSGNGVSTDVVGACIRAYVNALNKIVYTDK